MKTCTEAIILSQIKYGENQIILNTFTKKFGAMNFAVRCSNSRKKTPSVNYLQVLFQNEIEFNYLKTKNLQTIEKISPAYNYKTVPYDTAKTAIVFFLSEILKKTLYYAQTEENLYNFISSSLQFLDLKEVRGNNFHLKFLLTLSKYLGVMPKNNFNSKQNYFNISKAEFTEKIPDTKLSIQPPYSLVFSDLLKTDFIGAEKMKITNQQRNYLLNKIVDYYCYRFENISGINSLEILHQLFH